MNGIWDNRTKLLKITFQYNIS